MTAKKGLGFSDSGPFLLRKNKKICTMCVKSVDKHAQCVYNIIKDKGINKANKTEVKIMKEGYYGLKDWFYEKTEDTSSRYQCFIDVFSRKEDGQMEAIDGYYTVRFDEILAETEKAVQVKLSTGLVVGSCKGWTTWIPKSVIKEVA